MFGDFEELMNQQGELSNQVAPCILYHFSYLLEEKGFLWAHRLEWRKPIDPEFLLYCNSDWCCVGIYTPKILEYKVEEVTRIYPFRRIYSYESLDDIKELSFHNWENIVAYYDEGGERGSWFRGRWKNEKYLQNT